MLTLITRTDPEISCEIFIDRQHWMPLYLEVHKNKKLPKRAPKMGNTVRWIAMLGGFLGRAGDGDPGITTLWRGW
ncbi:MAG: IS4 family transposase, partial [Gammaproteobacteria bacterium]|nr:IS4 family transposase [Gammaproteobacteria bacterium]